MSNPTPPTHGGRFIELCTQCTLCLQAYVVYVHVHVDDSAEGVLAGKYIKAAQDNIFQMSYFSFKDRERKQRGV